MKSKFYAPIPHKMFELTPKELYLYYYLQTRKLYLEQNVVTNVNLISCEVDFFKKEQQNKEQVIKSLLSLKENGYIDFKGKRIKSNSYLKIAFEDIKKEGYTKIPYVLFSSCFSPEEFTVLCLIKRWFGINKKKIFISEFVSCLDKSEKYTKGLLQEMIKRKMISCNNGKYSICILEKRKNKEEKPEEEKTKDNKQSDQNNFGGVTKGKEQIKTPAPTKELNQHNMGFETEKTKESKGEDIISNNGKYELLERFENDIATEMDIEGLFSPENKDILRQVEKIMHKKVEEYYKIDKKIEEETGSSMGVERPAWFIEFSSAMNRRKKEQEKKESERQKEEEFEAINFEDLSEEEELDYIFENALENNKETVSF